MRWLRILAVAAAALALCAGCRPKEKTTTTLTAGAPPAGSAAKPPAPKTVVVTEGPLNLRAKPGTKGTIVGRLSKGEKVLVLAPAGAPETIDGKTADWYRVETIDKKQGFVFGGYLDLGEGTAPATAGTAGAGGATPAAVVDVKAADEPGWKAADYYLKGKELAATRKFAEALPYLKAAQELSPQTPAYWNELGLALLESGRYAEAAAAYEQVRTLRPDDFWAHNNLGLAYLKAGKASLAVPVLEKALTLEPRGSADPASAKAVARKNLAAAYEATGQKDKAAALR